MPEYVYICDEGHEREIYEPMVCDIPRTCHQCNGEMWRKPSMPMVNWNGLRPSEGELHPHLQEVVEGADQRRAEYAALKENYERERSADSD